MMWMSPKNEARRRHVCPPPLSLLDIRWVCAVCLAIVRAPLEVNRRWAGNGKPAWEILAAHGPLCHGREMLLAGEPKVDRFGLSEQGRGALVDPVDNLRIPV